MNAKDRINPTTVYGLTYALFAESLSDPCRVDSIVTSMLRDIESRVEHSTKDACPPEDVDVYNYWMTYDKELGSTPRRAVEVRAIEDDGIKEASIIFLVVLVVSALTLTICTGPVRASSCGSERWAIKTGADGPVAGLSVVSILSAVPTPVSVLAMRSWAAPVRPSATSRVSPHESTLYRVTADLIAYKVEKDEDAHLVIAEPSNHTLTMIAEIPNPTDCMTASPSILVSLVRSARSTFLSRFPLYSLGKLHTLPVPVRITITGIGFFDKLHGQSGLAPNGIELHPVSAIGFDGR